MARFYDRLRRYGEVEPTLRESLGGATIIDATNLSDYLYLNEAKGQWDLVRDFFNLAPPFDKFFVECKAPKELLTKEGLVPWPSYLPSEWGVFLATDLKLMPLHDREYLMGSDAGCAPDHTRWLLQAVLFAETPFTPNGQFNGKIKEQFSWWFPVLSDGSQPVSAPRERLIKIEYSYDKQLVELDPSLKPEFVEDPIHAGRGTLNMTDNMLKLVTVRNVDSTCQFWYPDAKEVPLNQRIGEERWEFIVKSPTENYIKVMSLREDIPGMSAGWQFHYTVVEEQYWLPLLQPCLMSICMLHVKNVKMERVIPSEALQKKAKRRYGEPLCSYHILHIQPFKKVLEDEGHVSQSGIRKAMHICHGHFHHYGDGVGKGKLFGKYSGTYWIPAHIRGSIDNGLMDKSYKVNRPK